MTVDEMEDYCARLERDLEVLNERYWESARKHAEKTTVMQAEIERLREALERLITDCMQSDFNEHWDTFKNAEAVLAGKELT